MVLIRVLTHERTAETMKTLAIFDTCAFIAFLIIAAYSIGVSDGSKFYCVLHENLKKEECIDV
jgi:hypothetical protein